MLSLPNRAASSRRCVRAPLGRTIVFVAAFLVLCSSGKGAYAEPGLAASNLPPKLVPAELVDVVPGAELGTLCSGDGLDLLVPFDAEDGTWTNTFEPFRPDGRNDDDSVGPISLPFTFTLYDVAHTQVFVNNNGNLTLGVPFFAFSAAGFPDASIPPMIAPFWGDVDTRSLTDGGVVWHKFIDSNTMVVTWDNVGHYNRATDRLNTFQVVITDGTSELIGIGQNIAFSYSEMCWTTGDASGGSGGFGGIPATVGVNAGDGENFIQIGRFNRNDASYDGPFGQDDGVDFLDFTQFEADVSQTNVPPIPTDFPSDNTFVIDIDAGESLSTVVSFLSPEADQTTSIEIQDPDGLFDRGLTVLTTDGNTATAELNWTPGCCDQGTYNLIFIASDDADGITTVNATVEVLCSNQFPVASAGGPYVFECQGDETFGQISAMDSIDPDDPPVSLTYLWSADCPEVSFDDPTSPTPMVTIDSSSLTGAGCQLLCSISVIVSDGVCEDTATTAISVEDTQAPSITPPSPIDVVAEIFGGGLSAAITIEPPIVTDNCTADPLVDGSRDDGLPLDARYPVGTTVITWTAADSCVHSSQAMQDVTVTEPPLPDLVIESVLLPASASEGDTISVSYTVRNNGTGPASGNWTDDIRLSEDNAIGGDTLVAQVSVSATVAPGETYTRSSDVTLPGGLFGDVYFVASADSHGDVFEELIDDSNEGISAAPVAVLRPDLVVSSVDVPSQVFIGESVMATWDVENIGGGGARRSWSDRIIVSLDDVLGNADDVMLLDVAAPGTLEPGELYQQTAFYTIPALPDTPIGPAFLFFVTDIGGSQPESDETNNASAAIPVDVALPPTPDLVVTIVDSPSGSLVGELIEVTYRVENAGADHAMLPWDDSILLSTTPDASGVVSTLGTFGAPIALAPGEGFTRSETVRLPGNDGSFFLIASTDVQNQVDELFDEDNNTGSAQIELAPIPLPDLVVTDITTPVDGVRSGQLTQISWVVTNQGTGATSAPLWFDTVFISQDPTLVFGGPGGDQAICNQAELTGGTVIRVANPEFLPAGESYAQSAEFQLPNDVLGPYFVYVITDRGGCHDIGGNVAESSNTNNITRSTTTFDIELAPQPDLVTISVVAPSTGATSQPIDVTWQSRNQGEAATATGAWTDRVYLSQNSDPVISPDDELMADHSRSGAPLGVGEETELRMVSATLPPASSGERFVKVLTDANNSVSELGFEGNNIAVSGAINVIQSVTPDLVVTTVAQTTVGALGHEISVNFSSQNIGADPLISGSWTDSVYLSVDNELDPAEDILLGTATAGTSFSEGQFTIETYSRTVVGRIAESLTPGDYFVIVMADSGQTLAEVGGEDNNSSASSTFAIESRPSDLAITADSAATTGAGPVGAELATAWTVENTGVEVTPTGIWSDRVLLSDDMTSSGDDIVLGVRQRAGALDAAGSYNAEVGSNVPDVDPGQYFLIFQTDSGGDVFEQGDDGSDNTAVLPFEVNPSGIDFFPDLALQSQNLPSSAGEGASFTVDWSVGNIGGVSTGTKSWTDRIVLSADTTADFGDTPLAFVSVDPPIESGGSYSKSRLVTLPAGLTGDFFLILQTDAFNSILEFDEANNSALQPITITGPPPPNPNLIARDVSVSGAGVSGETVEVSFIIENTSGVDAAGAWQNSVFLSTSMGLQGGARLLGAVNQTALPAGDSHLFSETFQIPLDLPAGDYFAVVVADSGESLNETPLEGDNTGVSLSTVSITEPPRADLTVSGIIPPSTGTSGQSVDLSWSIDNVGAGTTRAASRQDRVFLSRDQFFSAVSDVQLGTTSSSDPIDAGGSQPMSASFNLPLGVSGEYFVIVQTDTLDGEVEPAGDAPNTVVSATTIDVDLPLASDLVVDSVTPPSLGTIGQSATFMWTTRNIGGSPASGRWDDRVFLSVDPVWDIDDVLVTTYRVPETTIGAGSTADFSVTVDVPAVLPGEYFVIVRTDARNQIPETNTGNNSASSLDTVIVDVPILVLGVPESFDLPSGGDSLYRLDALSGETIDVSLIHHSPALAWTELFVAFGRVPTIGDFDFSFDAPAEPSQTVRIPFSETGSYFILARATANVPSGQEQATLRADALPFAVESVSPSVVGAGSRVTVEILGSRFRDGAQVRLELPDVGGEPLLLDPISISIGGDRIRAGFDLSLAPLDTYDVVVTDTQSGDVARLDASLRIEGADDPFAAIDLIGPDSIRVGAAGSWTITFTNLSNVDIPHAILDVSIFDVNGTRTIVPITSTDGITVSGQPVPPEFIQAILPYVTPATETLDHPVLVTGVAPGETVEYTVRVETGPNSPAGAIGVGAAYSVLTAGEFVNQYLLPEIEAARQLVLTNPGLLAPTTGDPVVDAELQLNLDMMAVLATDQLAFETFYIGIFAENGVVNVFYDGEFLPDLRLAADAGDVAGSIVVAAGTIVAVGLLPVTAPAVVVGAAMVAVAAAGFNLGWTIAEALFPPPSNCGCCGGGSAQVRLVGLPPEDFGEIVLLRPDGTPYSYAPGLRGDDGKGCGGGDVFPPGDPNEKRGPFGFDEGFVNADPIRYQVFFENMPEVQANAAVVRLVDPIDPGLSIGSFRLGDIQFGDTIVDVPEGRNFFQTTLDLTDDPDRGVLLRITAGVDAANREAFWEFISIDPDTGEVPADPLKGFLPPNVDSPEGEGNVEFFIAPAFNAVSGARVSNQATIIFDTQDDISTNIVTLTIDPDAPSSAVTPLPLAFASEDDGGGAPTASFPLTWSGSDVPGGSGLTGFSVFVSVDGGTPALIAQDTTDQSGTVVAQAGSLYEFFSVASDAAGNEEAAPLTPDTRTVLPTVELDPSSDTDIPGDNITTDTTPTINIVSVPDSDIPLMFDGTTPLSVMVQTDALGRGSFTVAPEDSLGFGMYIVTTDNAGILVGNDIEIVPPPTEVSGWSSVASHGPVGEVSLPIDPAQPYIEPRTGGVSILQVGFTSPVDPSTFGPQNIQVVGLDVAGDLVDLSGVNIGTILDLDGSGGEITFTPSLPDVARYCVELVNVQDVFGNDVTDNSSIVVVALVGDVTDDGRVTGTDVAFIRDIRSQLAGGLIDPSIPLQVRADITSDGRVNATDIAFTRALNGNDTRGIADPCLLPEMPDGISPGNGSSGFTTRLGSGSGFLLDNVIALEETGLGDAADGVSRQWPTVKAAFTSDGVAIRFDPRRFVVRDVVEGVNPIEQMRTAGVDPDWVSPFGFDSWLLVELPSGTPAASIRSSLEDGGLYTSQVLRDDAGEFLIPRPALLVAFEDSVSEESAHRTLEGVLGAGFLTAPGGDGLPGVMMVQLPAFAGDAVIHAANSLLSRPGVLFTEPDFVLIGDRTAGAGSIRADHELLDPLALNPGVALALTDTVDVVLIDDGLFEGAGIYPGRTVLGTSLFGRPQTTADIFGTLTHMALVGTPVSGQPDRPTVMPIRAFRTVNEDGRSISTVASLAGALAIAVEIQPRLIIIEPSVGYRSTFVSAIAEGALADGVVITMPARDAEQAHGVDPRGDIGIDRAGASAHRRAHVAGRAAALWLDLDLVIGLDPQRLWEIVELAAVSQISDGKAYQVALETALRESVDVDGDGGITQRDMDLFLQAFNSFDPAADLNSDGRIDIDDLTLFIRRTTSFQSQP